jgi:hypothetical protein
MPIQRFYWRVLQRETLPLHLDPGTTIHRQNFLVARGYGPIPSFEGTGRLGHAPSDISGGQQGQIARGSNVS